MKNGCKGEIASMFKHVSLTLRMLLIIIVVGVATWSFLDPLQTRTIKEAFNAQQSEKLSEDADENKMLFDRYIQIFHQNVRLIISQKQFYDYVDVVKNKAWLSKPKDIEEIIYHTEYPQWLPSLPMLHSFAHFHYAFLLDGSGNLREVYLGLQETPPQSVLISENLLHFMNYQKALLTNINGIPYTIAAESLHDDRGRVMASLLLATPIDNEFLVNSQDKDHIVAFVGGEKSSVLSSNKPDILPVGTLLKSLQDKYLFEGKDFKGYGTSDPEMELVTFISKEPYKLLSKSVLKKERRNRLITALMLILSFSLIMIWITKRIQGLTGRVMDFSEKSLNIQQKYSSHGDELKVLDARFRNLTGEIVTAHDSLKKQAETLRKERDMAQNYLDIAGTIIMTLHSTGKITLINRKGCNVLGCDEREITGKIWFDNFIPEKTRLEAKAVFEKIMAGEAEPLEYYESVVTGKGGEERLIAWHHTVLKDETGKVTGLLSSGEDVTEHKRLEKSLIEIEERERFRVGQDLHDGLGQLLTGIAFQVRGLGRKLEKSSFTYAEDAAEISVLVDTAKKEVSRISKGLYPLEVDRGGLMTALEELASSVRKIFGVSCAFVCDQPVLVSNKVAVIQLYRIAQEAVTNAVKHGNPQKIEISLSGTYNRITMTVKDDGTGISDIAGQKSPGMGLRIMGYRASLINASLDIRRGPDGGTMVICVFTDAHDDLQ